jgi:DNA-binding LytR/AlgR family response regulator
MSAYQTSTVPAKNEIKLRCLAVDDEPFALKLIADDIARVPFLELCCTYSSPLEALEYVKKEKVDLLFLDIQMPLLKGTQFLRSLEHVPLVIFTTAYEEYALEGFELDVVDYLMKPIPFDRFLKAVNKAYQQFLLHKGKGTAKQSPQEQFFFVHAEYKEIKIFFDDVLYVEGLKDYVKIFIQGQSRPILTRLNLKAMEAKLPAQQFCRIHNSFIISLSKIESSQKSQVFIKQQAIPVGDKYAADFRKKYTST